MSPVAFDAPAKTVTAIALVTILALVLLAWATSTPNLLTLDPISKKFVLRLIILPIAFGLIWLLIKDHDDFRRKIFSRSNLTIKLVISAVGIGLIARLIWWAQITARASFALGDSAQNSISIPLTLGYQCPELPLLTFAILTWWFVVPIFEEFVFRGLALSYLAGRGPTFAILVSTTLFALAHPSNSIALAFALGTIFGILYWNTGNIWAPIISHASYNGIQVFDWLCLRIRWNPSVDTVPLLIPGFVSVCVIVLGSAGIYYILINSRAREN